MPTLRQRLLRLQVKFLREDGFRVIRRDVAERFSRRFTARIVTRRPENGKPFSMLILDDDHPDVGRGTQLLAFLAPYPPEKTEARPSASEKGGSNAKKRRFSA